jgi:hypothetical protein
VTFSMRTAHPASTYLGNVQHVMTNYLCTFCQYCPLYSICTIGTVDKDFDQGHMHFLHIILTVDKLYQTFLN